MLGLIDDAFLIGTEGSFKVAVDSKQGESLSASDEYAEASRRSAATRSRPCSSSREGGRSRDRLRGHRLRQRRPDPAAARRPAVGSGGRRPLGRGRVRRARRRDPDDGHGGGAFRRHLVERLPIESWAAIGVPDLGPALERTLDQLEHERPSRGRIDRGDGPRRDRPRPHRRRHRLARRRLRVRRRYEPEDDRGRRAGGDRRPHRAAASCSARRASGSRARRRTPRSGRLRRRRGRLRRLAPRRRVARGRCRSAPSWSSSPVAPPPISSNRRRRSATRKRFRAGIEALGDGFEPSAYLDLPALFAASERGGGEDDARLRGGEAISGPAFLRCRRHAIRVGLAISRLVVGISGE